MIPLHDSLTLREQMTPGAAFTVSNLEVRHNNRRHRQNEARKLLFGSVNQIAGKQ